jgi:isoquinoline 1-oxidoreductase alpha subunit
MLRVGLIVGSTRVNRFADIPVQWLVEGASTRPDLGLTVLDLRDIRLPFFNEPAPPIYTNGAYAQPVLGMTGTKFGCGMALCGACTVHLDGVAIRSCITSIDSIGKSQITTIEAIGATAAGAKIQKAWLDREVVQCGYCQSGQIMSASALLASKPHPTDSDFGDAMSGNIRRCGTYVRIREAIKQAAQGG